jgi:GTP-binding protein
MKIEAQFVRSAASARDLPRDGLAEIGLVGRSNVGKSSLINALVGRSIARTSAAPGKTRLANLYRVTRGGAPFYLVDLPGYGYARGDRGDIEAAIDAFFSRVGRAGHTGRVDDVGRMVKGAGVPAPPALSALLVVDTRHPGLESDIAAWQWLQQAIARTAVVATKIDKLARGQRIRALRQLESVFQISVLPVSAVTGEGLEELWKLIDRTRK